MAYYKSYVMVWIALIVLTGATVGVSFLNLGLWNAAVALVIASTKATLVGLYFMHLRHEIKLVIGFALFPLLFLALIIIGTLSDTMTR
ncbi:cytochrome C oxidase subunit IV family protein [Geomonas sp. Red32]|uniref:cytochrome C oxidase subunit IV family protein n=1 Tax=Geomonas sp. Red32 TaxID=2912856 RepID=UPI00202CAC9D|nr:cytochrome C oxidase subunit IV family protein [Geomonas sp. Red32]MCM0083127.1 cytochrome C oxidase subunit IV family protein [Geomonas sp. Red32]